MSSHVTSTTGPDHLAPVDADSLTPIAHDMISPAHLCDLPPELVSPILAYIADRADLLACALVCKVLCLPALTSLYSRRVTIYTQPRLTRFLSSTALHCASNHILRTVNPSHCVRQLELLVELQNVSDGQLAQVGAHCPNLKHLVIHDAACYPSNENDGQDVYAWGPNDYGFDETTESGPHVTCHLTALVALTSRLESLTLKQIKSLDIARLVQVLAGSCRQLKALEISEMDKACRPFGATNYVDCSSTALAAILSFSALSSLHTLKLDDVCHMGISALILQHLNCTSLSSISLCNNYNRRTFDAERAFVGLLERHPRLVTLTLEDSLWDGDNLGAEAVRAALQVWPDGSAMDGTKAVIAGPGTCSTELVEQVKRKFGDRVILER